MTTNKGSSGKATSKTTTRKTTAKRKSTKAKGSKSRSAAVKLPSSAGKSLVIVESPAKARTVGQILGNKYVVTASQGHVRDLPKSKIGVDVAQDFEPSYVIMKEKQALLTQIKKAGKEAKQVYLATDPDREGEAISWHLQAAADWEDLATPPKRVVFHDGDVDLAPGISLFHIGGHTDGLQAVRVKTKRGFVMVASDACHLYANMETENPFPVLFIKEDVLAGYGRLKELADSPDHIVPGHDPAVMDRYPAVSEALEGIAIRLDVDPAE